ncbi:MAG: hypothetical protein M3Q31_03910 [Actinomycetota bacterium]|nr:hypothetical protein [Actinomycetota bacterium]
MDGVDLAGLRAAFLEAVEIDDPLIRGLEAAAVVSDAVRDLGVRLIVYGGAAVSLYTAGAYISGDVDAALAVGAPGVEERLRALGLEKTHRHWALPDSDRVVMKFPSDALEPGWETNTIELDSGRSVAVVTLEDIILDRIEGALSAGGIFDLYRQAILLCRSPSVSGPALRERAAARRIERELDIWLEITDDQAYSNPAAFSKAITAAGYHG